MRSANIFKKLAILGVFTFATGIAGQASAVPFTYQYSGGWVEGSQNVTTGGVNNDIVFSDPTSALAPADTFRTIRWRRNQNPQSRLSATNEGDPTAASLPDNGSWVTLTTLTHENNIIRAPAMSFSIDIAANLRIFDQATQQLLFFDARTIDFTETLNRQSAAQCPAPNPLGSRCDDFFTFAAGSLDPITFTDLNGDEWQVNFRLANFINSFFDVANFTVYTREATTSSLDLQMSIERIDQPVPEPGILLLMGAGLMGLGVFRKRLAS